MISIDLAAAPRHDLVDEILRLRRWGLDLQRALAAAERKAHEACSAAQRRNEEIRELRERCNSLDRRLRSLMRSRPLAP